MASSAQIDMRHVAAPIPGENPAGKDLRADAARGGDVRAIKDAREEARRIERQADLDGEESTQSLPHWRKVRDLGEKVLAEQSKDLEVAAFVIEALVRTDGFAGIARGFQCARQLVEGFWDVLYPRADEDGVATRVLPLARLNGEGAEGLLAAPIHRVPITQPTSVGPYASWHYRQSAELAQHSDRERDERVKRGAVTSEQFQQAVAETQTEFFCQLVADLEACASEYHLLSGVLEEKCGKDEHGHSLAPPSSNIRLALESCLGIVRNVARDRLPQAAEALAATPGQGALARGSSPGSALAKGLETREDAFRVLLAVAEFFERTEPLSLLGTQIRKVARLGRMTPAEYYSELIEDRSVRDQLFKMVGIKPPEAEEAS